ncbi:MAG: VWA domain-containing protein [Candidatus Brocadiaceae bacterium]|nr:VWA domain-containing protein [Candidatus Brocadiaceae bacterium]
MNGKRTAFWAVLIVIGICRTAGATGILVPEDSTLPPLAIQNHRVHVTVEGPVAVTRVSQRFLNSTNRRLEATYIFPIPRDAAVTDFAMFINGKRQSGEVVEAGRARQIYQDIVRRLRDPGLLEYMDSGLLRMRVFPIEPNSATEVEVSYTHALPFESGVYEYTFPLKTGERSSKVLEDFTLSVEIASDRPIKSVYSPTHDVGVTRKDDYHALAGFEQTGARLDTDFTLFYTVGEEDFGLNLLTHRRPGQDGYFALMIAPRVAVDASGVMPKDVCFAIDVSGSMQEQNRIESARQAVAFCLNALNPGDRFALVTFSTGVETYGDGLTDATPEAVAKAVEFVRGLEARGGTDLCEAVLRALKMTPQGDRPYLIVLATDGKPTVGVTAPEKIVTSVAEANRANVRVFPFGIAEDLNVVLLDRIAETTRGYSDYVAPGREIETKISTFFRKVSHPVLSNLELSFGGLKVSDMYPQMPPDLFRGSQVVAFGRYSGEGDVAVQLTGAVGADRRTFAYDATFPAEDPAGAFLPQLWARRKIGYLLDQIRLHGQTDELTDEVVRLGREYGIATPYTSYLILENEDAYRTHGIPRMAADRAAAEAGGGMQGDAAVIVPHTTFLRAAGPSEQRVRGRDAVEASLALRFMKESDSIAGASPDRLRRVGERTFLRIGETWVDTALEENAEALELRFGSDAYFAAVDALPELAECLALGDSVTVVIGGKALVVAPDRGREEMTPEEIRQFFARG